MLPHGCPDGCHRTVFGGDCPSFFAADAGVAQLFKTLLAVTQRGIERAFGRPATRAGSRGRLRTTGTAPDGLHFELGGTTYASGDVVVA